MIIQEEEGGVWDALKTLKKVFVISSDRKDLAAIKSTNHKLHKLFTHFLLLVLQSIYTMPYISTTISSKQIKHIPFLREPAI